MGGVSARCSTWGATAETVDLAAVTLGRSSGPGVALSELWLVGVAFGCWRAVIVETIDGDRGADPPGDHLHYIDDSFTLPDPCLDMIADLYWGRGFGVLAVYLHMATTASGRGVGSSLGDPDR